MPRRLAVAKHAGGFDALGWSLLGFLLGASLAVFALLHADIRGLVRPFTATPGHSVPQTLSSGAVISYTPPAPASRPAAPVPVIEQAAPGSSEPAASATPHVNALASAGAASVHAASPDARPRSDGAPAPSASSASPSAADAQVDDDAAAAGMTSRTGAPRPSARAGSASDLF